MGPERPFPTIATSPEWTGRSSCHSGLLPPNASLPALCPGAPPACALILIHLDTLADSHLFLKTAVLKFLVSRGL